MYYQEFSDRYSIPQLGYGVALIGGDIAQRCVESALESGYRHLDTAQMYGNDREVGYAISASGVSRNDLFITSKLHNAYHDPNDVASTLELTLQELKIDYLDLFLIHWPMPFVGNYIRTWEALLEGQAKGLIRSVGVSNFEASHLERIFKESSSLPVLNQIECHPYFRNDRSIKANSAHAIVSGAWSPLANGRLVNDSTLLRIAEKHHKSVSQVVLRWHLQNGRIVTPKSTHDDRIRENIDVFDFSLTPDELRRIDELDCGFRTGPVPDEFHFIPA